MERGVQKSTTLHPDDLKIISKIAKENRLSVSKVLAIAAAKLVDEYKKKGGSQGLLDL
jgi:hypothetical protein